MPRIASFVSKENIADMAETPKKKRGRPRKRKNSEEVDSSPQSKSPRSDSIESPSTKLSNKLIEQLNVTTPKSTSKFRSARRALADNTNLKLPGREAQFEEITSFLNEAISDKTSASMYINGPPGKKYSIIF